MGIRNAYDAWSASYDSVRNATRDLETVALRTLLAGRRFAHVLELGCGTGKNTGWLAAHAERVTAIDFSTGMLAQARARHALSNVVFRQGDIAGAWNFVECAVDLVTCSLVLEHVEHLDHVFGEAAQALGPGGTFYVGELHPFRQYEGSRARFADGDGATQEIAAFTHHLSDYTQAARAAGLDLLTLREWFDDAGRTAPPRIVAFVFRKPGA